MALSSEHHTRRACGQVRLCGWSVVARCLSVVDVVCCTLHVARCLLHVSVARCLLHACRLLHVVCCTLHAACCTLHFACCMLACSDRSAVSKTFTSALASFSAEWKVKVGSSLRPNWPDPDKSSDDDGSLIRAEDDDGVAIEILRRPYSLGFISLPTAAKLRVPVALISNHAGTFVAPTTSGVQSAMDAFAAEMGLGGVNRSLFFQSIVDPKNQSGAYPIAMFTYFLFDAGKLGCSTLFDLVFLIHWVWTDLQAAELASPHNLVPVSATVRDLLINRLANLQCRGSSVLRSVLKRTRPDCPDGT